MFETKVKIRNRANNLWAHDKWWESFPYCHVTFGVLIWATAASLMLMNIKTIINQSLPVVLISGLWFNIETAAKMYRNLELVCLQLQSYRGLQIGWVVLSTYWTKTHGYWNYCHLWQRWNRIIIIEREKWMKWNWIFKIGSGQPFDWLSNWVILTAAPVVYSFMQNQVSAQ